MVSTPGTVRYPAALDDADSLIRAANNAASTLAAPLLAADTTATLVSVAAFPASGSVSLSGGEILYYTGKGANTLTGLVRAREGTTAVASLAAGTRVELRATARHHTVLADAIIATQTKLGGGASSPVDGQFLAGNGAGASAWTTPTAAMISDFGAATDARLAGYAAKAAPVVADKLLGTDSADSSQKNFTLSTILNLTRMGVFVDDPAYGAVGDGTTDDTLAIRAAITAAGTNGTVVFKPGKTYLLSGSLVPLQGQTWWCYGATLKRRDAISTTTATAITTSGNQALTVADASSFRVGMDVTVYNGGSYEINNHRITSIVGSVITLGASFTTAFPSGGTLITSTYLIASAGGDDISILGLEIDGNQSNNAALQKWELHAEIYLSGSDRSVVRDCYVHDAQSEGIELNGVSITCQGNWVVNCQGNGIHLSGSTHAKVIGNYVKNTNLAGTGPGHADGCIIASLAVGDTVISGNYIENGIAGIGAWDNADNASLVCTGNVIRNCTSYAFEGIAASGETVGLIVFADNLVYSSGTFTLNYTGSFATDTGPYRIIVARNYFEDTAVSITKSFGVQFTDNVLYKPTSPTSGVVVSISDCVGLAIHNNRIRLGQYGIYVDGSNGRDISIQGNHCKDQYTTAIRFNNKGAATGYSVKGNTIVASASVSATYNGIVTKNNVWVDGNILDLAGGQYGIVGDGGAVGENGAIITSNLVRSVAGIPSIRFGGGTARNIAINNLVQQAVNDAGSPNNTVSGTVTIF